MSTQERTTAPATAWVKRWQEPDGSWHIVLTPAVLNVVPRETFRKFQWALAEMDECLAAASSNKETHP
jgi:hypothetical protein